jgi:hypothetical protein
MNGQWLGEYSGSSKGTIIVNIDERESDYQGVAHLLDADNTLPISAAFFATPNKESRFSFRTNAILAFDPTSGIIAPWESVKRHFPENVTFSKHADVSGSWNDASLTLSWVTDAGAKGNCVLQRSKAGEPSSLVALDQNWEDFQKYVTELIPKRPLFRGQKGTWRLRTAFHRSGRADLHRYVAEDVPALYRHLSARLKHVFNLNDRYETGAFYNLAQHHGYPTPLLDWTYSPYVAAFFAYRGITNNKAAKAQRDEKVRIFVFDQALWKKDLSQPLQVIGPGPYLSVGELMGIENERMIPQQADSTVTNVDDIETYIKSKESDTKKYLWAIDLPMRDRKQILRQLSYMGITAGSLFPGLDGACQELKERNFDI